MKPPPTGPRYSSNIDEFRNPIGQGKNKDTLEEMMTKIRESQRTPPTEEMKNVARNKELQDMKDMLEKANPKSVKNPADMDFLGSNKPSEPPMSSPLDVKSMSDDPLGFLKNKEPVSKVSQPLEVLEAPPKPANPIEVLDKNAQPIQPMEVLEKPTFPKSPELPSPLPKEGLENATGQSFLNKLMNNKTAGLTAAGLGAAGLASLKPEDKGPQAALPPSTPNQPSAPLTLDEPGVGKDTNLFTRASKALQAHTPEIAAEKSNKLQAGVAQAVKEASAKDPKVQKVLSEVAKDTGYQVGTIENLMAAQKTRDDALFANDIAKYGLMIGTGLSGTDYKKMGGDILDEKRKEADKPVKDFEAKVANQKNDPKSQDSVTARAIAAKLGFPFGENVSAADIEKRMPGIESLNRSKETAQIRADAMREAALNRAEAREQRRADKKEQEQRLKDQFGANQSEHYQKMALSDTKDLRKEFDDSEKVLKQAMMSKNNWVSSSALGTMVAKARGERGALTEEDVTRYVRNPTLAGKAISWLNKQATGTIPEADADTIGAVEKALQGQLQDHLDRRYKQISNMYSTTTGIDPEVAYKRIRGIVPGSENENNSNTGSIPPRNKLKVGDIVDGHTYLGGDPGKKESWKE